MEARAARAASAERIEDTTEDNLRINCGERLTFI